MLPNAETWLIGTNDKHLRSRLEDQLLRLDFSVSYSAAGVCLGQHLDPEIVPDAPSAVKSEGKHSCVVHF